MAKFHDLFQASGARDCARLRQLVRDGIDINCKDSMKRTVLHYAAAHLSANRMKDVIRTLVDLGADINAGDIERRTPLHLFLSQHCFADANEIASAMAFLISLGADINATYDGKVTSLHRAIKLGNILGLKILLKLGVDVNAFRMINVSVLQYAWARMILLEHLVKFGADVNSSFTLLPPLLEVIELGRLDMVKLLVEHGADVNAARQENFTSVIYASNQNIPQLLKSLAQLGANLNVKLSYSHPINEIVKFGRVDILEYLIRHGADTLSFHQVTALGNAVTDNFHETVDCLLRNGADVNVRYIAKMSPFVTAMRVGDTDMMRALARLAPHQLGDESPHEEITVLQLACECDKDPKIMELLLKYGGDVHLKYDLNIGLAHEAVAEGNGKMLRVLAELGANLNCVKQEGVSLIHHILNMLGPAKAEQMALTKLLVAAGLDLNRCYHRNVTPLHDAVRLGDLGMVQILVELKANIFAAKEETTPFFTAIQKSRTNFIRYLADNRINVNSKITKNVTPLHDAVCQGDVDMARILVMSGANTESEKNIKPALHYAIDIKNNDVLKCLLECGVDINAKACYFISALHDAVEKSDLGMIDTLTDCRHHSKTTVKFDQITPLYMSIQSDQQDITETLLKHGADMNCSQQISMTPLDVALDQGKLECALLLMSRNVEARRDAIGLSPLHAACALGHIDLARLLIFEGSDVNKQDNLERKPLECLPLIESADYHVLQETTTASKVTEQVLSGFVSTSGCQDMTTSLHTPGIGDVKYISSPSATEVSQRVNNFLTSNMQQCASMSLPGIKVHHIGSSAEGTRVGLPNEMDFLFEVHMAKDEKGTIVDLENGYAQYEFVLEEIKIFKQTSKRHCFYDQNMFPKEKYGSQGFHLHFIEEVMTLHFDQLPDEKVSEMSQGSHMILDTNRKACSLLPLYWNDGKSAFTIPVDIVPSLHIDSWPEGATTRTWLMDENELRSRGYVLVPKPPHVKSDLAKACTEEQLRTLWKISFPHLETEHMQRLEQRVKDVYSTAKCLRNPDVCRIMITDEGSLPKNVSKYVTSYQLKMCFFKNVEYFRQHYLSLEEMVCKVYDDLVLGLSKNFIPLFFLPKVSALSGIKINVPKSLRVAKIMARFVQALCLRDSLGEITDGGDDIVMTVYQRDPGSVYRVHDISNEDVCEYTNRELQELLGLQ